MTQIPQASRLRRRRYLLAGGLSLAAHALFFAILFVGAAPSGPARGEIAVRLVDFGEGVAAEQPGKPGTHDAVAPPVQPPAHGSEAANTGPLSEPAPTPDVASAHPMAPDGHGAPENTAVPVSPAPGAVAASGPDPGGTVSPGSAPGAEGMPGATAASDEAASRFIADIRAAIEARKAYPRAARMRGTEGVVRLRLRISGDGRLIGATIAASSGSTLLDRAALDLVHSIFPRTNPTGRELDPLLAVSYSLTR